MEQDSIAKATEELETIDAADEFRRLQDRYNSRSADEIIHRIESLENERDTRTGAAADGIQSLNETIEHLHGQLESLYAEKEQLEMRINSSNAAGIIETFEGLEAQLALCYAEKETRALRGLEDEVGTLDSLELQLQNLYNEREILEEQYGVSGSEDIRLMLDNLNAQLAALYEERENYVIMDGDALIIQGPRKFFIKKTDS